MPFRNTRTALTVVRSRVKKATRIIYDKCRNSDQRFRLNDAYTNNLMKQTI